MKQFSFFLFCFLLFFLFAFFGCTQEQVSNAQEKVQNDVYKLTHPCPAKACNDLNNLNKIVVNIFDFNKKDYSLECVECSFPYESIKGSYSKVRIDLNEGKVDLYYNEGLCAKLGYDCFWEACISIESKELTSRFEKIKTDFCSKLESKLENTSPTCANQILYDSNTILEKCLRGDFETFDGNYRVFSVIQNYSSCGSFVQRGKINCFD